MARSVEEELAVTAEQVEQRVAMGDEVETPRTVDHLAYFPRTRARAAQEDLRAAGFTIDSTRRRLFRTAVEFSRVDAVDSESAAAFTRQIATMVAEHDGEYDGWSGLVVGEVDAEPADAVPVSQVVEADELARLRSVFVERVTGDGCDRATAERLSAEIDVLADGSFSLNGPASGFWHPGGYSPSQATKHVQEQAEFVIEDNRERRRPRWTPA